MAVATEHVGRTRAPPIFSLSNAARIVEMVIGALLLIFIMSIVLKFDVRDPRLWAGYGRSFIRGFWGTVGYIALILPISVGVGFGAGWARASGHRIVACRAGAFAD